MSDLHLLRHAKAMPQEGGSDRERPLEERGRRAAQAVAQWMAARKLAPDLVLCSPSLRTRQTLDLLAPAFPAMPEIRFEDGLYLAGARQLLARLRNVPATTKGVLLVGHNPGLHELALALADVTTGPLAARLAQGFPTAALASYRLGGGWPALDRRHARLVAYVTPKELMRGLG